MNKLLKIYFSPESNPGSGVPKTNVPANTTLKATEEPESVEDIKEISESEKETSSKNKKEKN